PAGTKYVAFRHYNCSDLNYILLDDIQFTMGGSPTPTDYTYTVYRDGTKIKEGLTETTFEEDGVATGNHEYCVEVKYTAGVSPKVCVNVTINPTQFNPVKNLKAQPDGGDVVLKWEAPSGKRGELLNEDFEGDAIPTGWTALDADGDGNNWDITLNEFTRGERHVLSPLRASNVAISYSSLLQGQEYLPLTPNNFLITPKVEGAKKITYKVGSPGLPQWSHDHYALCISKSGTAAADFEVIFEETMTYTQGGANLTREKDLPAGTKYVAFRHYNCTDVLGIMIDDVVITGEGEGPSYTYTVYRDGTKIQEGLTETTYRDAGMSAQSHEYCVEVKYAAGVSPKVCVDYIPDGVADVTAQKPYTLTVVGKTITVTCQGEAMIYDMNGRRLAAGRNTVVYTAQGGYYAVMVVVDGKSYVEKLAIK
ncbi:choice-of-anchor J domain-containing protein, partial [Porphyromonas gingivalis]